jgi:preprotein translocase subunit SecG
LRRFTASGHKGGKSRTDRVETAANSYICNKRRRRKVRTGDVWTDIERMQHVIIVIHLMLVLALIGVVLLQRSEGGGLGIGSTGGFMTSRGTANVLTRATAILAGLFFVTSLLLSILAGINRKPTSVLQGEQSAPAAPGAPAPLGGGGGGLLNQLQGGTPPAAPAAPSGPQVPQSK